MVPLSCDERKILPCLQKVLDWASALYLTPLPSSRRLPESAIVSVFPYLHFPLSWPSWPGPQSSLTGPLFLVSSFCIAQAAQGVWMGRHMMNGHCMAGERCCPSPEHSPHSSHPQVAQEQLAVLPPEALPPYRMSS